MSDGTTSQDITFDGTPSVDTQDFYSSPEYAQMLADNPTQETSNPTEADVLQYLDHADASGAGGSLVDSLKRAWSTTGNAIDTASAWAKANPGLASMITSGVGNAQKQKYSDEQLQKMNQFKIDAETRAKADALALWERRNQSIIDAKPANLGIIGNAMLDNHVAYLQGRK